MKKNRANKTTPVKKEKVAAEKPAKAPKKPKVKACAERGCRKPGAMQGYCRLHYFANWRALKEDEKTRAERRLNAYVDRLAKRYPTEYLEKIKEGIENEDSFKKTMEQLEIDAENESETERE
ncbi:hypothetical protein K2X33_02090, partial [bacterium]|nr:hypothetical protein [bacterium]